MATTIEISVIIPTYNRIDCLLRCLAALQGQTLEQAKVEIIVVDDGSTDDTCARLPSFISSGVVRYFHQSNSGPARARNVGLRAATGHLVLFLGDDIMATPQLLAEHVAQHHHFGDQPVAVVGLTEWSPHIEATPLMRCPGLGENFEYHLIQEGKVDPENLPYRFFYTSNVSVRRSFMLENDLFFDEEFAHAMGEDGELGYRVQKQGLRIVYNPSALAYHEHLLTFESLCRRRRLMGQVSVLQVKKHPGWGDLSFLDLNWKGKIKFRIRKFAAGLISPWLKLADQQRWAIHRFGLYHWYEFVFQVYQFEGLLYGLRAYGVDPQPLESPPRYPGSA